MSTISELPKWDLTPYFPAVNSEEYRAAFLNFEDQIGQFEAFCAEALTAPASQATVETVTNSMNGVLEQSRMLGSFVRNTVCAQSSDEIAQAAQSLLKPLSTRISKLSARVTAWIGEQDIEALAKGSPLLTSHLFPLQKTKIAATHLMTPAEEALASDLSETGGQAWSKLYSDFTSNIMVAYRGDDLPMSAIRSLATDADSSVREEAYNAELAAWELHAIPLAAAMNSIKGQANYLTTRRGWESQLHVTLFQSNMDRDSLDAMLDAARDAFPSFRRYFQVKAALLGRKNHLPFHDLFAPIGEEREWSYEEGKTFVEEGFRSFSDKMADLAVRSYQENWIDAGPRKGKVGGAYCSGTRGEESRILLNFKPAFGAVSTLAHELGHAYHNLCLRDRAPLQKSTPMTLAETASIFCETIIKRRALKSVSDSEKLSILEAAIQGSAQVVVDISSRYEFESALIDKRAERELSSTEMCDLMKQAQLNTYGDGLDPDRLHPYMWAAKPHYYSYSAFYNFPYMFGLLFALGLYAQYEVEPQGFQARYDDLLSNTGLAMAADLTQNFGINIHDKAFWAGSLRILQDDIDLFEALAGSPGGN